MEQFGRDEEVLGPSCCCALSVALVVFVVKMVSFMPGRWLIEHAARDADHSFVDEAFVAGIHALVDLVDDTEGGAG